MKELVVSLIEINILDNNHFTTFYIVFKQRYLILLMLLVYKLNLFSFKRKCSTHAIPYA